MLAAALAPMSTTAELEATPAGHKGTWAVDRELSPVGIVTPLIFFFRSRMRRRLLVYPPPAGLATVNCDWPVGCSLRCSWHGYLYNNVISRDR